MSVRHVMLALLDHTPAYGYQLHGLMESTLGDPWAINIGQIYSTLSRLEREGLVRRRRKAEAETGDRTVYEITGEGKTELAQWLREPLSREYRLRDTIYAKLVLSNLSGSVSPEEVLQAQRRQLLSEMHELTRMRSDADPQSELLWILLLESAIMHLEADLRWLDMCEARLEDLDAVPPPRYKGRPRGRPPKAESTAKRS